jgi:rod shape-determining protein MreD
MTDLRRNNLLGKFLLHTPIILLYIAVINDFNFNYLGLKYFSFNFSFILIFYYSLKRSSGLGYVSVFFAGIFNDVVIGIPIGISSLLYLLLCGAAAYLRNITLRPNLMKDWLFFLGTILILNSLSFLILTLFFDYIINFYDQLINILFTFLLYYFFSKFFGFFEYTFVERFNAR